MKQLITEEEKKEIKKMYSLDEQIFSNFFDKIKSSETLQNIKNTFKKFTGLDFNDETESPKTQPLFAQREKIVQDFINNYNKKDNIKITKPSPYDDKFYEKILKGIGAPITDENMKFLYAWRQGEKSKAKYNPFNTTRKKNITSFYNCLKRKRSKCVDGVKNYKTEQDGIDATIETLKLSYYSCITDGLKNNIGAKKIAKNCNSALKTWGTGDLVAKVLDGNNLNPPPISTSETTITT